MEVSSDRPGCSWAFPRPVSRPKAAPAQPVDGGRVAGAAAALVAVFLGVVWLVGTLPRTGAASTALAAVLGLMVSPVTASPIEWFVHRFVYHEAVLRPLRVIFTDHTAHHYAYFPTWRYVTAGRARRLPIRNRQPEALGSIGFEFSRYRDYRLNE